MRIGKGIAVISAAALLCGAASAADTVDGCAQLAGLKLDNVEILSARSQPAGAPVEGATLPSMSGKPGEGSCPNPLRDAGDV